MRPDPATVLAPRPRRQELSGGAVGVLAPAKLNLDLLVGPLRADGFHPLDSVVVKVSLYDEIALTPREDGRIVLSCDAADCGPAGRNLAFRAATLLAEDAGKTGMLGADIRLDKHIPAGKGLGGGSSDAAAVLAGLDELWGLATPAERLAELAARLGSDVPMFLGAPASRMTGRGERLAPAAVHDFAAVLHMPEFACGTADVYRAFDALPGAGRPMAAREAMDLADSRPSVWRGSLRNDLTGAAKVVSPQLVRRMTLLGEACGEPVSLTGSGSAMFILADTVSDAQAVAGRVPPDLPGQTVIVQPSTW